MADARGCQLFKPGPGIRACKMTNKSFNLIWIWLIRMDIVMLETNSIA